ncbi:Uncharacterised protein [uncultured Clostridium sp.]|nr:Uncharacterised protein [uncultured Clostridium sp.]
MNKRVQVDMWYGNVKEEADGISVTFYPNSGEYRGNIYKDGKIIGDYTCKSSVELEDAFPQLEFNWD